MSDGVRIIPTVRPDGAVILQCPCGYQGFADPHGKAVCPRCNRGVTVEPVERVVVKEAPRPGRRRKA